MSTPYPLILTPLLFEKVWGGRRLERLGKKLPPGKLIGESWELADLAATSTSGAGGSAARSIITSGELTGHTLHDALAAWGPALLGTSKPTPAGEFPLLVKYLDARENLSVQVHPSPTYAAANPGANLKTESWYILDAQPGSMIYKGVKPGTKRESFAAHIKDNSVASDLVAVPAVVGDCHNLPSGTVHALGAGVLVAEVQTPSDTTFRVFDWGRAGGGRELHIDQALQCIDFAPAPAAARYPTTPTTDFARLVTTDFFTIDEAQMKAGARLPASSTGACVVLMILQGSCKIRSLGKGVTFAPVTLYTGTSALIPAAISAQTLIDAPPGERGCRVLRASLV